MLANLDSVIILRRPLVLEQEVIAFACELVSRLTDSPVHKDQILATQDICNTREH